MKTLFPACLGMLLVAAALPTAAHAQNEDSDGITVSGSATVVSDYRFRSFSQSNEEAAIQGGIPVSHDSGLYLRTWGSSIGFANGTERDVFGGYAREIAPGHTAAVGAQPYHHSGAATHSGIEPPFAVTGHPAH